MEKKILISLLLFLAFANPLVANRPVTISTHFDAEDTTPLRRRTQIPALPKPTYLSSTGNTTQDSQNGSMHIIEKSIISAFLIACSIVWWGVSEHNDFN